jgi:hypothetical protein
MHVVSGAVHTVKEIRDDAGVGDLSFPTQHVDVLGYIYIYIYEYMCVCVCVFVCVFVYLVCVC